ncbi:hypothetical protein AKJ16_DCAP24961 [Drosera capensis]
MAPLYKPLFFAEWSLFRERKASPQPAVAPVVLLLHFSLEISSSSSRSENLVRSRRVVDLMFDLDSAIVFGSIPCCWTLDCFE